MEIVTDSDTATGSRNPSPSLPEGANTLSTDGDAPMELDMYKGKPTASADIKTTPELPPSSCSTTERSNSPASVGESDERSCGGDAVSVEDGGSECSGEKHGAVLTDAMLKEEQRLHDTESRESSSEREKVTELKDMVEHQRFLRLQHLLERSTIYSKFMLRQMEEQREREKKEEEKNTRHRKIVTSSNPAIEDQVSDKGQSEGRVTRSGSSLKSPEVKAQSKGSGRGKMRGRKRKANESSYKISDFVDNQGQLKKRKLDSGKAALAGKGQTDSERPTNSGGRKNRRASAGEEVAEERYFRGQLIPAQQPKLFTGGIMRSYQIDGMEWIKVLYENGVNGILGDEMGLGKTIQCISVIAHMIEMGIRGPFLVAAPLSTVPNWVSEFKKFTPSIPVVLYHGTQQERLQLRRTMFRVASSSKKKKVSSNPLVSEDTLPVVVTSYEICMRDQQYLMNRNWKFLVVDEGHRIKNLHCKLIKALKSYDAANRLLLTGTPLQNNLAELWSLLNFLLPDIFDDLNSFQSWFDFDTSGDDDVREKIIAQEREQNVLKTLHQILTPFLLRRLKTDVEFSLPPKKEVLVYAPLTAYQEKYYKSLLNKTIFDMMEKEDKKKRAEMAKKGKENVFSTEGGVEEMECGDTSATEARRTRRFKPHYSQLSDDQFEQILSGKADLEELVPKQKEEQEKKKVVLSVKDVKMTSVFMMLRKCCNHPYLLEFPLTLEGDFLVNEQIVTRCGKIMLLDRMLPTLIKRGHKTLIFSQFTSMLDILEDYLELRSLVYSRLDGSMGFAEREEQMTMFRESPDCHIFLLSTRAGGLGINLTNADTVIIYDSDWNPQCDLQAQDRCHRIGQTKPVMVYRFVTANTIDQRIVERAASKRRLEKMVIHKGKFKGKANDYDFSLDDLVELLHSVDHHNVVDSSDAVVSDEQLEALLDRTLTSQEKKTNKENKTSTTCSSQPVGGDQSLFKVIEERDADGHVTRADADSAPTTDNWHIVSESESITETEKNSSNENSSESSSNAEKVTSAIDSSDNGGCEQTELNMGKNACEIDAPLSVPLACTDCDEDKTVDVSKNSAEPSGEVQMVVEEKVEQVKDSCEPKANSYIDNKNSVLTASDISQNKTGCVPEKQNKCETQLESQQKLNSESVSEAVCKDEVSCGETNSVTINNLATPEEDSICKLSDCDNGTEPNAAALSVIMSET